MTNCYVDGVYALLSPLHTTILRYLSQLVSVRFVGGLYIPPSPYPHTYPSILLYLSQFVSVRFVGGMWPPPHIYYHT